MQLAEVHRLVDAVGGIDPACCDREGLAAAVTAAARLRAWLDGRHMVLAAQMEHVASFPEKALADAARTSLKDAERHVQRGHTTALLPPLGDALADGAVSGAHVDVAGRALGQLGEARRDALIERADWLVGVARRSTPDEFRQSLATEVRRIQTGDGMAHLERQRRACRLRTWVDHRDGMWCVAGRFDPATGARLHGKLETAVRELLADRMPAECPTDPGERQDFLRAHGLVALLDAQVSGGPGRPEVVVVVDTSGPEGAAVDWGIPVEVPWRVLQDLAGEADVHTVVVRNGVVLHAPGQLDLGRSCRTASRAQRRTLRALYATCAIPGCAVKYDNCRLHHVIWWDDGGPTDLANLLPTCERHHHCIHDKGWVVSLGPNRELRVETPDGQVMTTGPPRRT